MALSDKPEERKLAPANDVVKPAPTPSLLGYIFLLIWFPFLSIVTWLGFLADLLTYCGALLYKLLFHNPPAKP